MQTHSLHCYYTRPVSLAANACNLTKKFYAIGTQSDNATILWLQVQLFQTSSDLYRTFLIGCCSWNFGILETDVSCTILSMKPTTHITTKHVLLSRVLLACCYISIMPVGVTWRHGILETGQHHNRSMSYYLSICLALVCRLSRELVVCHANSNNGR